MAEECDPAALAEELARWDEERRREFFERLDRLITPPSIQPGLDTPPSGSSEPQLGEGGDHGGS